MKLKEIFISSLTSALVAAGTALAISPPFSTPWNTNYETIPADTEQESLGASRIRDLKAQLRLRLSQDHSWNGDGNDGYHKQVTLISQSANPIPAFDAGATGGVLFTELINGEAELLYADNNGHTTQLTSSGSLLSAVPSGTVAWTASNTVPGGWLACNGNNISRTADANLFAAIGTTYGNGDGSTTFGLPNVLGRTIYGFDPSNSSGRLTGLSGGISASAMGNTGGGQQFTIAANNLPQLGVTITDPGHSHTLNGGSGIHVMSEVAGSAATDQTSGASRQVVNLGNTDTATTGITATANTGGANNPITAALPPGIILNCIIKTENDKQANPLQDTYAESDSGGGVGSEGSLSSFDGLLERRSKLLTTVSFG